jgi:hypothetical protein
MKSVVLLSGGIDSTVILASWGCDSVDGTYLTFGPRINLPKLLRWLAELELG